jgi:hypothetical protein
MSTYLVTTKQIRSYMITAIDMSNCIKSVIKQFHLNESEILSVTYINTTSWHAAP